MIDWLIWKYITFRLDENEYLISFFGDIVLRENIYYIFIIYLNIKNIKLFLNLNLNI